MGNAKKLEEIFEPAPELAEREPWDDGKDLTPVSDKEIADKVWGDVPTVNEREGKCLNF